MKVHRRRILKVIGGIYSVNIKHLFPSGTAINTRWGRMRTRLWETRLINIWEWKWCYTETTPPRKDWSEFPQAASNYFLGNWFQALLDLCLLLGFFLRHLNSFFSFHRKRVPMRKSSFKAPLDFVMSFLVKVSVTIHRCTDYRSSDCERCIDSIMIAISTDVLRSCLENGFSFFKEL